MARWKNWVRLRGQACVTLPYEGAEGRREEQGATDTKREEGDNEKVRNRGGADQQEAREKEIKMQDH